MNQPDTPLSSPSARKLAAEHGIDLSLVQGTGPAGKVTRADVEAEMANHPAVDKPASVPVPPKPDVQTMDSTIAASPLARRLAVEKGIDLSVVVGSGPGGKIVKADVENLPDAAAPGTTAEAGAAPQATASRQPAEDSLAAPGRALPLNNVRKTIARRLTEAKQTIPHIYLTLDIRLDALLDLRSQINSVLSARDRKVSVNDFLIKALAKALQEVPACNVSFNGDTLIRYSRQDISVAVAAPSGLITPIIRDAANKDLSSISAEMRNLVEKARADSLKLHEFQGGTATLSNLGMFGIKQFKAVINPPQAMILAVGAAERRAYVDSGEIVAGMIMSATGSFDHRAIDGADGARLLQALKMLCENPLSLLA